jgi:acetolactate synthase-1/3 small subunit
MEREITMATSFEQSGKSTHHPASPAAPQPLQSITSPQAQPAALTPHQLLMLKSTNLQALTTLSSHFGARLVDVSENSVIIELSAKSDRVDAFLGLVKGWGVLESARTGVMVMPRTPISNMDADEEVVAGAGAGVDASMLPPG